MNEDQLNYVTAYIKVVQPAPASEEAENWVTEN
jgi:hypothetical protein